MDWFPFVVGVVGIGIVGLVALVVVWDMWRGTIDLSHLLSDSSDSSLSRFQFLLFTFVIGFSYLLLVVCRAAKDCGAALPDVPGGTLALLGISAGSYVLSKGIQKAADTSTANARTAAAVQTAAAGGAAPVANPPGG